MKEARKKWVLSAVTHLSRIARHLKTPADQLGSIIDAHAPYTGQTHSHDHEHHIVGQTHTY